MKNPEKQCKIKSISSTIVDFFKILFEKNANVRKTGNDGSTALQQHYQFNYY